MAWWRELLKPERKYLATATLQAMRLNDDDQQYF